MIDLFDRKYSHRVSQTLKDKVLYDAKNGAGFIARGILEAIRLLEGENVAPSTRAMRHKERELKGELAGFFHIHVAEDNFSRLMNNFGEKTPAPIKNPRPDELIAFATNQVFKAYAKKHNISFISDDIESIRDAIVNSRHTNKIGINKVYESINKQIPLMVDKVFSSHNKVSGDWLLYKKYSNGENYYLDFTVHVDAGDKQRQIELRDSLLASFQSLTQ